MEESSATDPVAMKRSISDEAVRTDGAIETKKLKLENEEEEEEDDDHHAEMKTDLGRFNVMYRLPRHAFTNSMSLRRVKWSGWVDVEYPSMEQPPKQMENNLRSVHSAGRAYLGLHLHVTLIENQISIIFRILSLIIGFNELIHGSSFYIGPHASADQEILFLDRTTPPES